MDVHIAMPVCWGFQDRCAHSYRCVLGGRGGGFVVAMCCRMREIVDKLVEVARL